MDQSLDAIISGQDGQNSRSGHQDSNQQSGGNSDANRSDGAGRKEGSDVRPPRRRGRGGRNRKRVGGDSREPLRAQGGNNGRRDTAGTVVVIKNLHRDIYSDDLRDLFREVGPVTYVSIEEDVSGHRTGLAWVQYQYPSDAAVAAGRYDGRRAKGQILTVHQVSDVGSTRRLHSGGLGSRIGQSRGGNDRRNSNNNNDRRDNRSGQEGEKGSRGRGRRGRGGREPVVQKTAEELDAELDAYMRDGNEPEVSAPTQNNQVPAATQAAVTAQPQNTAPAPAAEDIMIE